MIPLKKSGVVCSGLVVALQLEVIDIRQLEPRFGCLLAVRILFKVSLVFFGRQLIVTGIPRLHGPLERLLNIAPASDRHSQ